MSHSFEQGPIRPPSEARSLLLRVTRNCPWNRCAFCHAYSGTTFQLRSVEEIKRDIRNVCDARDKLKELSWEMGDGGRVTESVARFVFGGRSGYDDMFRRITLWMYYGGETIFLQDADSLIMKTDDLEEVLLYIMNKLPEVARVTSYCRSKTARRKSLKELQRLREAGLSRIHVGLESGYDPLLQFISKGLTASDHIEGGQKIVKAGISLCAYVMPGLGGEKWSREHALGTAAVLNEIKPDFIRLRSLHVKKGTVLHSLMEAGKFMPLGDEDVLREIRIFISSLDGIKCVLKSDHILNLLEELEGRLPEDREKLVNIIDRYFDMTEEERLVFRLGRRKGLYRRLSELADLETYRSLKAVVDEFISRGEGELDRELYGVMHDYI